LRAQDVSHFHNVAGHIRDIDEANAKKREFEEEQKQKKETTPKPQIPAAGTPSEGANPQNEPQSE
jgi:hypothetical protein